MAPGSVAVIVGASRGIGLELARIYLGQSNLQLVALSRNADNARKAILDTSTEPLLVDVGGKKDTKAFDDSRLTTIDIDVREEDSIREASEKVKEKFGSDCLRLLFNVSGIVSPYDLGMCDVYSYYYCFLAADGRKESAAGGL